MASEKSFLDRLQRSNELKVAVAAMTPVYAPADAKFSLATFGATLTAAGASNTVVDTVRPPHQDKVSDRVALVKSLGPLITQALAYVKSNSAWANRYEAIKKLADKVRGVDPLAYAKTKARKARAETDPDADEKARESGEQSYVEIAAHLKNFNDRLEALGTYTPPNTRIGIDALMDLHGALVALNGAIPGLARTLADAITDRQTAFAALKTAFDGVKTSVKGQYGQTSVQFDAVRRMSW